jgi:SPP1 gp7 family putative phage head morphogenesis protein
MANKPIVPQRIENDYSLKLRKVAKAVGILISHHTLITKDEKGEIVKVILANGLDMALRHYSNSIEPWAKNIASLMLGDVNKINERNFLADASQFSERLKSNVANSNINNLIRELQENQITQIKSLPLEAGRRAKELAQEAAIGGRRASVVAEELAKSEDVAISRANTIARTEIHTAYAKLTEARADLINSNEYIWTTAGDEGVRDSHAEMDGVVCNFKNPPTLSDGTTCNAGEAVNCRCYAKVIVKGGINAR